MMVGLSMQYIHSEALPAIGYIAGCRAEWRVRAQILPHAHEWSLAPYNIALEVRAHFLRSCETLERVADDLGMNVTKAAARRAYSGGLDALASPIGYDAYRLSQVVNLAEQLLLAFNDEMEKVKLFALSVRHARLYDQPAIFGEKVAQAFPTASFDISEAGVCMALGRWTAAVMHLMRVMEVGLSALASHYSVSAEANWNQVLNQIEAKSREVTKRTHDSAAEQWAAEAATHLRFVKNAWRNPAMHPHRSYDEAGAATVFENTKAFMQHLAEKLTDGGLLV